jgi:hypothetical protein
MLLVLGLLSIRRSLVAFASGSRRVNPKILLKSSRSMLAPERFIVPL